MNSWAENELDLAGYWADDRDEGPMLTREGALELLRVFQAQNHSRMNALHAVQIFSRLASGKPLTPLTGDDDEWGTDADANQSKRFSAVFRDDNGTAYWSFGIVYWEWVDDEDGEPYKYYFTNENSAVAITFPFAVPDEPEYRELDSE